MSENKKKVLIIEDEIDLSKLIKVKFESYGFEVHLAFDGPSGLQRAVELIPDCVLLDIKMPEGDGLTVLRELRSYQSEDVVTEEQIRRVPVIVLTGSGDNMRPLFEAEGVSGYFEKPFDAQQLRDRVLALTETR